MLDGKWGGEQLFCFWERQKSNAARSQVSKGGRGRQV